MNEVCDERKKKVVHWIATGLFLIGLAVLFHFDALWPWVLALVGVYLVIEAVAGYFLH